jgi:peptidoglycan biosynthesis protein MviN/MurJ (putative lipid II flippase)
MNDDPNQSLRPEAAATEQADPALSSTAAAARQRLITLIMIAVVVWGGFLATGAWLQSHDWRRPAMVMGCVIVFLGFWVAMLARRRSRFRIGEMATRFKRR